MRHIQLASGDEQLRALDAGQLHVTGLNTGAVPLAVNACGFVPVGTLARADGSHGYTMQIIVRADSDIEQIEDLREQTLAFTDSKSNSGFKVPVVLLKNNFDMLPERDYAWRFTHSHFSSIATVAEGKYDAAAVASDILKREIARSPDLKTSLRVIYESEQFPPAALGYAWNLEPKLAAKLRAAILDFKWSGSGLEQEFKASEWVRFAPVSYKDDFALIRRIDDALGQVHVLKPSASTRPAALREVAWR